MTLLTRDDEYSTNNDIALFCLLLLLLYIYVYIYVCMYVCIYIYMYVCIYTYMYISIAIYIYLCIFPHTDAHIHIAIYMCVLSQRYLYLFVHGEGFVGRQGGRGCTDGAQRQPTGGTGADRLCVEEDKDTAAVRFFVQETAFRPIRRVV